MSNLTTAITWTPVDCSLPDRAGRPVLISSEIPMGAAGYIEVGVYTDKGWMLCGAGRCDHPLPEGQRVTHWAPLPIGPEA